jgi:hypothetical protein
MKNPNVSMLEIRKMLSDPARTLREISSITGYSVPELSVMAQAMLLPPRKRGRRKKEVHNG